MNKEEYLDTIKEQTGLPKKEIDMVIDLYLDLIVRELIQNQKTHIANFGTFHIGITRPHSFFSPVDGRTIHTPGIRKVYFTSSKTLLARIAEK